VQLTKCCLEGGCDHHYKAGLGLVPLPIPAISLTRFRRALIPIELRLAAVADGDQTYVVAASIARKGPRFSSTRRRK
jgi:hypothetical protein